MRFFAAILLTLILPIVMKSQNATATIGNPTACTGDTLLVPLDVTNFFDVAAMTLYIGYDTNTAEFLSLQNINPAIAGWISYNASNNQIGIAYSNVNPFNIANGKLFDLRFRFYSDSTLLPFNPGTEIANSNLTVIPLDTFSGSIANSIVITQHPDSLQSYPNNDVIFRVTTLGPLNYQWQVNSGSVWSNLQNNQNYSGVNNDTLFVANVPLSFNNNLYRCLVSADNCSEYSGIGLLEVATAFPAATLGQITSCPENVVLEPLFTGDFLDVIEFTFDISYNTSELTFLSLENIHPELLPGTLTTSPMPSPPGISVHWSHTNSISITSGKLFDLKFDYGFDNQLLVFEPTSIVLNSFSNPISITLTNGRINQLPIPVILTQPENDTVIQGTDAHFMVECTGAVEYQWQVSTDDGQTWNDLTEGIPYYNTTSPELKISPVTLGMNGYRYVCEISSEYCSIGSASATLFVDTLTAVTDINNMKAVSVFPQPCRDKLFITLPENFDNIQISLHTLQGQTLINPESITRDNHNLNVQIDMSGTSQGLYLLKIVGQTNGEYAIKHQKVIKTD